MKTDTEITRATHHQYQIADGEQTIMLAMAVWELVLAAEPP